MARMGRRRFLRCPADLRYWQVFAPAFLATLLVMPAVSADRTTAVLLPAGSPRLVMGWVWAYRQRLRDRSYEVWVKIAALVGTLLMHFAFLLGVILGPPDASSGAFGASGSAQGQALRVRLLGKPPLVSPTPHGVMTGHSSSPVLGRGIKQTRVVPLGLLAVPIPAQPKLNVTLAAHAAQGLVSTSPLLRLGQIHPSPLRPLQASVPAPRPRLPPRVVLPPQHVLPRHVGQQSTPVARHQALPPIDVSAPAAPNVSVQNTPHITLLRTPMALTTTVSAATMPAIAAPVRAPQIDRLLPVQGKLLLPAAPAKITEIAIVRNKPASATAHRADASTASGSASITAVPTTQRGEEDKSGTSRAAAADYIQRQPQGDVRISLHSQGLIDYTPTRFDKDWTPLHESSLDTALRRAAEKIAMRRIFSLPSGVRTGCIISPLGWKLTLLCASADARHAVPPRQDLRAKLNLAPAQPLVPAAAVSAPAPHRALKLDDSVTCATARISGAPLPYDCRHVPSAARVAPSMTAPPSNGGQVPASDQFR